MLPTLVREFAISQKGLQSIWKHLVNNENCRTHSNENCVEIIDFDSSFFRFELKEAMNIIWEKTLPNK